MFTIHCKQNFNPRPPWGGRLSLISVKPICPRISIHALRGEGDILLDDRFVKTGGISIHALRGEGDAKYLTVFASISISIHTLRGEGDYGIIFLCISLYRFQSTPSVGRATYKHRPRKLLYRYFNPHPPWGGRLFSFMFFGFIIALFQSTPSVGRATNFWQAK